MLKSWIVLDISTAPIPDAGSYVEPVSAPSNYKDAEAIAKYEREKTAERIAKAAVDLDLAQITGIATLGEDFTQVELCRNEADEATHLAFLAEELYDHATIITYGGSRFDLPLLMRRARYLGVPFPKIEVSPPWKSPHVDLCDLLSDRDPSRRRSLGFYVKRLGWTDISKPLAGEDEARVIETGRWDELAESLRHDVTAAYRLAKWLELVP